MWINDDSGWAPDGSSGWLPLRVPNGSGGQVDKVNISIDGRERAFRVYLLPYNAPWQPSQKFVFVPHPNRSTWEQLAKVERELIIYIDEYGYYWQLCRQDSQRPPGDRCKTCCDGQQDCWVQREGWNGTPDFQENFGPPHLCGWFYFPDYYVDDGQGNWIRRCQGEWMWQCPSQWPPNSLFRRSHARLLFRGKVTTVPISSAIEQAADAAVDNRPVCPNPAQPPTYAKFGTYTYLGGLFIGQVPWWYGNQRTDWQTAPDLSGTGRILLRFYNPDGFPAQVAAACLSLVYTATPNGVALSNPAPKPIGVRALPQANWQETEVSWKFLEENNLHTAFTNNDQGWIGTTETLSEPIRPSGEGETNAVNLNDGTVQIVPEAAWTPTTIKRVVIPLTANVLNLRGQYAAFLLALKTEAPFRSDSPSQPTWYYFLGKEHPSTDGSTCPRLWYVAQQQP